MKIFNTLTHQLEQLELPRDRAVRMYTCGPTVYDTAHIGNLRSYILADVLVRALRFTGYEVNWVMNITDIDDKTIKRTIETYGVGATVENLRNLTEDIFETFLNDLDQVGVDRNRIEFVRVTDVIAEIQDFILELIESGYAYKADDGSTYFSIAKYQDQFGDYGQLVGDKFLEGKQLGIRIKNDEYEKENLADFVLWKAHDVEDAQIFWEHPRLGRGRPGWHIECSVVNSVAFDAQMTDIHTGGIDLVFPHHTNEIAQTTPLYNPFTHYWVHTEHLLIDGKKMAKSAGNFYTLRDIEAKGFSGRDLRYAILSTKYNVTQNFTWEALSAAHSAIDKIDRFLESGSMGPDVCQEYRQQFEVIIENDLNTPQTLALIFDVIGSDRSLEKKICTIATFDQVLSLGFINKIGKTEAVPEMVTNLLAQRDAARLVRNFEEADALRIKLDTLGYEIMDTPEGSKVRKK